MKHFFIRFQLVFVSLILLATFAMVGGIAVRNNYRWDATSEKIYSISPETEKLLKTLEASPIEVLAFYPHDDPARPNFEFFLRQCQLNHRQFHYSFYDPDRVPGLAKKYGVKSFYTVVIQYQGRTENIVEPSEESVANALLRLSKPKQFNLCFVTGHGESSLNSPERNGLLQFHALLETMNYSAQEILLLRDKIPAQCQVLVAAGPHQDFDQLEFKYLKKAFLAGRGILFLIDPMDPGTGKAFKDFMREFGMILGEDVIVDKASRLAGGDFLVPLVSQYVTSHPVTAHFQKPTVFPVSRSLQPSDKIKKGYDVVPLALTGPDSWAETNLQALEKGDAVFEPAGGDLQGPIPLFVSVERDPALAASKTKPVSGGAKVKGRLIAGGDSDFLTNAYLNVSGNSDFALNMIQWLTRDDRFISIHPRQPEFKPLFLTPRRRGLLVILCSAALPLTALLIGAALMVWRRRTG